MLQTESGGIGGTEGAGPDQNEVGSRLHLPFTKFKLSNGLTVIVHEDRKAPVVAVNIWYRVGAKDEPQGQTGFAHLFEHLMCGGSSNLPGSIIPHMTSIGATEVNATTSYDRTNYFETVPTQALDFALFAESDRMGHFAISADTLEMQRGVVLNEKKQREGGPYGLAGERIFHSCYPVGHPYAHTVIGSEKDIENATLDDVQQWFRTYYGPSNAVLVLAGDVDVDTAREKVERYFGDIPPGPPLKRPLTWVARREGVKREVLEDRVPAALLQMVWNTPEVTSLTHQALDVATQILGAGASSRLHRRLVVQDRLANDVSMGVMMPGMVGGLTMLEIGVAIGADLGNVETAVNEELTRFIEQGPSPEELARVVRTMEVSRIRALTGMNEVADLLAANEVYHEDPGYYRREFEYIEQLSTEDVRLAVKDWLSDGAYILHIVPFGDLLPTGKGVDRSSPPMAGKVSDLSLPPLQEAALSNGIRVLLAERHELPLIECALLVPGGFLLEPRCRMGVGGLTLSLMSHGAGEMDAEEFVRRAQELGATLIPGASLDRAHASLSAMCDRLPESLDLYADMVLRPRFEEQELDRKRSQMLHSIEREAANPEHAVGRVRSPLLYGKGHPFARALLESTLSKVAREDVVDMHRRLFDPKGATLIVVGDTTLEQMLPMLESRFGAWAPSVGRDMPQMVPPSPARPGLYLLDYPGAPQSTICGIRLVEGFDASTEDAITAVNHVVGGSFSSRINMNLRETKNWTYGANSGLTDSPGKRGFLVQTSVQSDKTGDSIQEMIGEMDRVIGDKPITDGELGEMRDSAILSAPAMLQTMGGLLGAIDILLKRNLPLDHWSSHVSRLEALTTDSVNAAAKKLIDTKQMIWIVAGDRSVVEPQLVSLGLGPVNIIDPKDESLFLSADDLVSR